MDADEWKNYRPVSNMTFTPKLVASRLTCSYLSDLVLNFDAAVTVMGGATGVCGGTMSPHFWDQRGTGGTGGGSNENDLCFYSRQSLLQVTEFQLP